MDESQNTGGVGRSIPPVLERIVTLERVLGPTYVLADKNMRPKERLQRLDKLISGKTKNKDRAIVHALTVLERDLSVLSVELEALEQCLWSGVDRSQDLSAFGMFAFVGQIEREVGAFAPNLPLNARIQRCIKATHKFADEVDDLECCLDDIGDGGLVNRVQHIELFLQGKVGQGFLGTRIQALVHMVLGRAWELSTEERVARLELIVSGRKGQGNWYSRLSAVEVEFRGYETKVSTNVTLEEKVASIEKEILGEMKNDLRERAFAWNRWTSCPSTQGRVSLKSTRKSETG